MKIVLASQNKKKLVELRAILSECLPKLEVLSLSDVGITEDIVEDGKTFAENALIKARAAATSGYIGVGDDSGLCVDALGGAPGIYSARYAGTHADGWEGDDANLALLLCQMEKEENRAAAFHCAIACVFPDGGEPIVCEGRVEGEILRERSGEGGFGYDPAFYYPPYGCTFGELAAEKKNQISHRAVALRAFAAALYERLNDTHKN